MWRKVALIAGAVLLGGCTVTGRTEPVGHAEVYSVPADLTAYPSTYYDGHPVYYVDNRWVYRDRDRWVYYRSEPPPLYRYRSTVRQAPPAPRTYSPAHPHRQPYPAQPHAAPPATRVR